MNSFPKEDEIYKYINTLYAESCKQLSKYAYRYIMKNFKSPKEFLNSVHELLNNNNGKEYLEPGILYKFIIFFSLREGIRPQINIQSMRVTKVKEILKYFNLVSDDFWIAFDFEIKGEKRRKQTFLIQTIKALIYLEKNHINLIDDKDLIKLRNKDFFSGRAKSEAFPTALQNVLAVMNKKSLPRRIGIKTSNEISYGTESIEIKNVIKLYLKKRYVDKGYRIDSPLFALKAFFTWIHGKYENIKTIEEIRREHWEEYKKNIQNDEKLSERTKQVKIDMVSMFFNWIYKNNLISQSIVQCNERYKRMYKCKPRMFKNRLIYTEIINAIIKYEPSNNIEWLVKQYLLIASATGLRLNEVLWLGPDCLVDNDGESAEVILQIKEKLGAKNKTTSVLKWGIEPLKQLISRFLGLENKIKFYNKKLKTYFYSLFQDDKNKMLSQWYIYKILNEIIKKADIRDEDGTIIKISNSKIHGFRHQKFNDIYEVTGGSLTAVKIDSGHKSVIMAKTYTQQDEIKRQRQALKLIESGKVVGKGVEIIQAMLKTPYSAHRYLEIVKKMNQSTNNETLINKEVRKYLGFGFCSSDKCKNLKICESCDFFYTCETYLEDLKERYSKNFALFIINNETISRNEILQKKNKEFLIDLLYQEKWLKELGVAKDEIETLRTKYY